MYNTARARPTLALKRKKSPCCSNATILPRWQTCHKHSCLWRLAEKNRTLPVWLCPFKNHLRATDALRAYDSDWRENAMNGHVVQSLLAVLIIIILLLNFVLLGSHWLKNYIIAFAAESWLIALLAIAVGYFTQISDLYIVGALTLLFRGIALPWLMSRIIQKITIKRELHAIIPPSTSLIVCGLLVVFAFMIATHLSHVLHQSNTLVVLALMVMLAIILTGFLLLAIRDQAISKVLALLVIENGIFLGSLFLVPGMPMFVELVILFDLLIVVASFGVLVDQLTTQVGSTSTRELNRLIG